MQCPTCGYESIAEEAVFCPQCRHQFREPEYEVIFDSPPYPVPEQRGSRKADGDVFTKKEIRLMQVQLLQPAILVMLSLAAALYLSSGRIPELSIMVSTVEVRYGGLLCLFTGAVVAWIFYRIVLSRATSR
jgi:hypothetical protein